MLIATGWNLTGKPFTGVAGSIRLFICTAVTLMSACG
jgi:hypothetical protein